MIKCEFEGILPWVKVKRMQEGILTNKGVGFVGDLYNSCVPLASPSLHWLFAIVSGTMFYDAGDGAQGMTGDGGGKGELHTTGDDGGKGELHTTGDDRNKGELCTIGDDGGKEELGDTLGSGVSGTRILASC